MLIECVVKVQKLLEMPRQSPEKEAFSEVIESPPARRSPRLTLITSKEEKVPVQTPDKQIRLKKAEIKRVEVIAVEDSEDEEEKRSLSKEMENDSPEKKHDTALVKTEKVQLTDSDMMPLNESEDQLKTPVKTEKIEVSPKLSTPVIETTPTPSKGVKRSKMEVDDFSEPDYDNMSVEELAEAARILFEEMDSSSSSDSELESKSKNNSKGKKTKKGKKDKKDKKLDKKKTNGKLAKRQKRDEKGLFRFVDNNVILNSCRNPERQKGG